MMKMNMACSGGSLMRFRITYTNCPTVRSAGTRYLLEKGGAEQRTGVSGRRCGRKRAARRAPHFFLSISAIDEPGARSQITCRGLHISTRNQGACGRA